MSYNPNIPNASDFLSQSQQQIKDNFGQLNTVFGIDHVPFDSGSDPGFHNYVHMTDQTNSPAAPGLGFGAMYGAQNAGDTQDNIRPYWQFGGSALNYPMAPIVAYASVLVTTPGSGSGARVTQQSFGCTVSRVTNGTYNVTLTPPLIQIPSASTVAINTGFFFGVIGSCQLGPDNSTPRTFAYGPPTYSPPKTAVSFQIFTGNPALSDPDGFSFVVIQF